MAGKYKAMRMRTSDHSFTYTIMYWDGEGWISSRPVRYYKTLAGAEKAIKKIQARR